MQLSLGSSLTNRLGKSLADRPRSTPESEHIGLLDGWLPFDWYAVSGPLVGARLLAWAENQSMKLSASRNESQSKEKSSKHCAAVSSLISRESMLATLAR